MAARPSDHVFRHVRRVFNLGAVGTVSDSQLLDWLSFRARRLRGGSLRGADDPARADGLWHLQTWLQDVHDAQDAFQAVFLVLANRARSIRRKDSVASWLFGVAQRVAARARSRVARRRAIDKRPPNRHRVLRLARA